MIDEEIARGMLAVGSMAPFQSHEFNAWLLHRRGVSFRNLRKHFPNEMRLGQFHAVSVIHSWVTRVEEAVQASKAIDRDPREHERNVYLMTIPQDEREVEDRTAASRRPKSSFPDADNLRAVGKTRLKQLVG